MPFIRATRNDRRASDQARLVKAVRVNGIDMHFERRGEGEPLLLLHGGGGAGVNWRLIFDSPPPAYQLIVPDLRGHGRSTNPTYAVTFPVNSPWTSSGYWTV